MGDQLYVDVWAPKPVNLRKGLAEKYERYWGDPPYQELLAACPKLVSCDDHEFWNDFPEPQIQVPYSWDRFAPENADALHRALRRLPGGAEPGRQALGVADVAPVSFFIADTRSNRTRDRRPATRALALRGAVARPRGVGAELKGPGVLVLPQPLLKTGGSKTDRTLRRLQGVRPARRRSSNARSAARPPTQPHDILILTGDIHTGRVSTAEIVGLPGQIYELVASPASLVTPYLPPWGHKPGRRRTG